MPRHVNRLSIIIAAFAATVLVSTSGKAQQNSTQNSGDCTVLVQGSNNNITISSPCSPTKNLKLADATRVEQADGRSKSGQTALQFTIREFVIDARAKLVYVSLAAVNHSTEPALVQIMTALSTIQLSDPPASISISRVQGLEACRALNYIARYCLEHAEDIESTKIPSGETLGFRLIGNLPARLETRPETSGALSLAFMKKVNNKYEKIDLSFLDIKLSESQ